jgi:hypothetical protein
MSRFQLSLRDVFVALTVFCVQLALVATYRQIPDEYKQILVASLIGVVFIAVPLALAVVVADVKRRLPLLSAVIAFVVFFQTCATAAWNDPVYVLTQSISNDERKLEVYGLVQVNMALPVAILCAWITRSLIPRSDQ